MAKEFKRPQALTDATFHYCPGCTHGIVHRLVAGTIDKLGIQSKVVGVLREAAQYLHIIILTPIWWKLLMAVLRRLPPA